MGFCAVTDAMHSSTSLIAIYEPDYALIRTVAVPRIEFWLNELGHSYTYNQTDHTIYTSSSGIGDIMFKTMANVDDLVGYESYTSHLDELDTMPCEKAERVWDKILGRNRQSPKGVPERHKIWSNNNKRFECFNKINVYTTPEGFRFCYKMWGDPSNKHPDYEMVRGNTRENPTVTEAYLKQLSNKYTAAQREAYLEGYFVNMESGSVYSNYDRVLHRSTEYIHEGDKLFIGLDFNVDNMCATVYVRRGEGGQIWHAVAQLSRLKDTPAVIREIQNRWQSNGHPIIIYPDASGASRKSTDASQSDITLLKNAGFEVRAHAKNADVRDRINAVQKGFEDMKVFVNDFECPDVAKCFENQSYDKNGKPDKNSGYDHQNDASTYPLEYELGFKKPFFVIPYRFA